MLRSNAKSVGSGRGGEEQRRTGTAQSRGHAGRPSSSNGRSRQQKPNTQIPFSFVAVMMILVIVSVGILCLNGVLYMTSSSSPIARTNQRQQRAVRGAVQADQSTSHEHGKLLGLGISKQDALDRIQAIRDEFHARYGRQSDSLLRQGLHAYGDIGYTARRLLLAKYERTTFQMAFSGYSITVGRGNYFRQSFPFVMESLLNEPLQHILGVSLQVHNGAIGGIPSFPYGFCLEHFLGTAPQVISWDYSMNEGARDSAVLEAWIRQSMQQLPNRPMIVMLDRNPVRNQLLDEYTRKGLLKDAVSISKADIVDKSVFDNPDLPPGFQHWDEFGAPKGCPGRGSWHPKKMEHEFIAWQLVMHFADVLERAVTMLTSYSADLLHHELEQMIVERQLTQHPEKPSMLQFPAPLSQQLPDNERAATELLYGHPIDDAQTHTKHYQMKDVSCRTSFLPATDHDKVLPSIIVSGMARQGDIDIMVDRTDEMYHDGWVLDVSKLERDTKRKVEACGGLGYIDMKIALYGVAKSGTLQLWLPFEKHVETVEETAASYYFDDLILCEANEKRPDDACKLDRDLQVKIDGIPVDRIVPIHGAGEYLRRTTCVNVQIPEDAKIAHRSDVAVHHKVEGMIGLSLEVTPGPNVSRDKGACCLSHIVWEQH